MIKKTILQYFADEHIQNPKQISQQIPEPSDPIPSEPKKIENSSTAPPTDPALYALYQECLACRACSLCDTALNL
ncbi:MAG: hypothetical protein ACRC0X_10360, partial [Brevinema sp.]